MSWNRNLLAAGLNGSALLWDMRTSRSSGYPENNERAAFRLTAHGTNKVCGVRWRDDGEMLATSGDDNVVCVWDMRMPKKPTLSSANPSVDGNPGSAKVPARRPMWKKKKHTSAVKVSTHIPSFLACQSHVDAFPHRLLLGAHGLQIYLLQVVESRTAPSASGMPKQGH